MKYFFVLRQELLEDKSFLEDLWNGKKINLISNENALKHVIQNNEIKNYKKLPPFKEGSIVRLTNELPDNWNNEGGMDHFLGKEVKLTHVNTSAIKFKEQENWYFMPSDIEKVIKY